MSRLTGKRENFVSRSSPRSRAPRCARGFDLGCWFFPQRFHVPYKTYNPDPDVLQISNGAKSEYRNQSKTGTTTHLTVKLMRLRIVMAITGAKEGKFITERMRQWDEFPA